MASSSSSGLTFKLHPLVIVNISDHFTRVKSQSHPRRVVGCVIGVQCGRTVEIFNSFELLYDDSTHSLDRAFLEKKQELYKKVFPQFYILGWYSTGSDAHETDMIIHKSLMDINENPVYVLLNPSINPAQKDLPVTIYESGTHLSSAITILTGIDTVEAERISVDHVAHLKPSDGGSAATQLAAHLTGIHSAIKMLNSRVRVLHHYLLAMQKGEIPLENSLLRQVSSLLRRLPAIESEKFQDDFLMEYNDTLLITYLAMFTNCSRRDVWSRLESWIGLMHYDSTMTSMLELIVHSPLSSLTAVVVYLIYHFLETQASVFTMNELVDKFNTAYDRHSRRGGRTGFI
ncbi:hypothetical protein SASPL_130348 [Salvia splendens]|uniref:COP9 signalosome complex subunit 6 n=1 Tax=Salvia splendens TaxID=180675 RepID=A0A8X8X725_SALSN|nr:hypothetical protein SASPL_130348 [Salvia splendens]